MSTPRGGVFARKGWEGSLEAIAGHEGRVPVHGLQWLAAECGNLLSEQTQRGYLWTCGETKTQLTCRRAPGKRLCAASQKTLRLGAVHEILQMSPKNKGKQTFARKYRGRPFAGSHGTNPSTTTSSQSPENFVQRRRSGTEGEWAYKENVARSSARPGRNEDNLAVHNQSTRLSKANC